MDKEIVMMKMGMTGTLMGRELNVLNNEKHMFIY